MYNYHFQYLFNGLNIHSEGECWSLFISFTQLLVFLDLGFVFGTGRRIQQGAGAGAGLGQGQDWGRRVVIVFCILVLA